MKGMIVCYVHYNNNGIRGLSVMRGKQPKFSHLNNYIELNMLNTFCLMTMQC